ncbi:MAG: sigma-70 family RNA polymerase sigma factor [Hyphomicrobiales bacterium]|nr:sigma-70 family RNA polymerase sigma factor [Hyphomicrobiales bacterium]MBV8768607.1 sigma-70 family RNA polymerase sigma factor [Hyphomicrobiales bacterium]MBV9054773.1 sigma-70 family RNA polymerase sigma factor [Hyphomicrobiales bacterium]MBV9138784.1 sigma-70 family RNA polymerase sigma factor [Hyphomicrobiales bacterium]MBV9590235.1 sigma-70 family RNA polymerase sigma factor [Hyphomicrobiales bacterium]
MAEADQRESERFRKLALPLLDEVYTFARYLTRNADEAEDAAQETYLRALRYFSGFSGESIKPWLFTILRNVLRSRDPRRFDPLPENDAGEAGQVDPLWGDAEPDPETHLARADDARQLRELIARLPTVYREALVLKEFNDFSYRQIAEVTGVPIGTVMSRLARAREELQTAWFALEKKAKTT